MSQKTEGTAIDGQAFWPAAQGEFGGHAYSPTAAVERTCDVDKDGGEGSGSD